MLLPCRARVVQSGCCRGFHYTVPSFSLQVKLYKSDNLDNPINSVSLGQSLFFHFPPLDRDGEVLASWDVGVIISERLKNNLEVLF